MSTFDAAWQFEPRLGSFKKISLRCGVAFRASAFTNARALNWLRKNDVRQFTNFSIVVAAAAVANNRLSTRARAQFAVRIEMRARARARLRTYILARSRESARTRFFELSTGLAVARIGSEDCDGGRRTRATRRRNFNTASGVSRRRRCRRRRRSPRYTILCGSATRSQFAVNNKVACARARDGHLCARRRERDDCERASGNDDSGGGGGEMLVRCVGVGARHRHRP